jgi:hypothetical protein
MRVITVSRTFPSYHIRAGEPTHFVEKIWESLCQNNTPAKILAENYDILNVCDFERNKFLTKHHTIRAGHRWKAGDMASLRVWADKPYWSKQIEFAQVEIKKVWNFEIYHIVKDNDLFLFINNKDFFSFTDYDINAIDFATDLEHTHLKKLAQNDGLTIPDFVSWFGLDKPIVKPFVGQIVCWNDEVNY